MLGFTGTFDGRPISVQSTGMGCPSAGIVFEELILLGATPAHPRRHVRRRCRLAACAWPTPSSRCRRRARTTTPLRYADVTGWAAAATFELVETAARFGREPGATVHVGPVVTSGIFYDPDLTNVARWERLGHLGIEMEAGMLYTIAAVKGVEALAMMTVSDILGATEDERQRISDEQLRQGVDDMIRVACQVATS